MRLTLITYGVLAGVTPALVLANSLLTAKSLNFIQPMQSMSLAETLMDSEPKTLAKAYALLSTPEATSLGATIIEENGQFFLEFYHSLNATAQSPHLVLALATEGEPNVSFLSPSDRYVEIGALAQKAGKHRYLLPPSIEVGRYHSVVIWCDELDTMMGYIPILSRA